MENIRILELQGCDIYYSQLKGRKNEIHNRKTEFDERYKNIMSPNLDLYYLESCKKLHLKKLNDEYFSNVFINVSFKYPLFMNEQNEQVYKKAESALYFNQEEIRKFLYLNGFYVNDIHYVRYKRSSGAAKIGSCLFIREDLYPKMNTWSNAGLTHYKDNIYDDLTSYEAYKALSLSSLITTLDLKPENILFVKDLKVNLKKQNVIKVAVNEKNDLYAEGASIDIENNIFDGEGLLDKSVFDKTFIKTERGKNSLSKKGMMLLRSRFFKCCAFNTNLKQWFKDNNITSLDQLKGVSSADNLDDILLIASESCLKYLKMCKSGFNEKNIKRWSHEINKDKVKFGVVKTDKPTRFFEGEMVETTYQFLNTLRLKENDVRKLTQYNIEYIEYIRDLENSPEFIRYFLEGEDVNKDNDFFNDDSEDLLEEEIIDSFTGYSSFTYKYKVCLELAKLNKDVIHARLFKRIVLETIVNSLRHRLLKGRILVEGTYATLFGNPLEFLKYIIKDKNHKNYLDEKNPISSFKENEVYCSFFKDKEEIVGSRAPHTTMGNLLYSINKEIPEIKKYFNLTKQIVVIDAINNNIQHRLSGCDYDSDSILLTNNRILVEKVKENYDKFGIPYADFKPIKKTLEEFKDNKIILNTWKIDSLISNNNVGQIVNLSQKLNSYLWDKFNNNEEDKENELYNQISILSVLSGAEIDSAKRSFSFDIEKQFKLIKRYSIKNNFDIDPSFFNIIKRNEHGKKAKMKEIEKLSESKKFKTLKTSMDYIFEHVIQGEFNRNIRTYDIPFCSLFKDDCSTKNISGTIYIQINEAIKYLEQTNISIRNLNLNKKDDDYDYRQAVFKNEIFKAFINIKTYINSTEKVKLLIKKLMELDGGFSKIFLLLFIILTYKTEQKITLKDLIKEGSKPLISLKIARRNEPADYIIFNKIKLVKSEKL